MAKLALPGASDALLARAEVALAVHQRSSSIAEADVVVAEAESLEALRALLVLAEARPIVILTRAGVVPPSDLPAHQLVLNEPVDASMLERAVGRVLDAAQTAQQPAAPSLPHEVRFPFVSQNAAARIEQAARLSCPLLVVGEPGSGRRRIAHALATWSQSELIVAANDNELASAIRLTSAAPIPRVVLVPDLGSVGVEAQERLASVARASGAPRLIALSSAPIGSAPLEGLLRSDLASIFSALTVELEPLRDRPNDLETLAETLVRRTAASLGFGDLGLSRSALDRLIDYPWPMDVAELEAVLLRTVTARSTSDALSIEGDEIAFLSGYRPGPPAARATAGPSRSHRDELEHPDEDAASDNPVVVRLDTHPARRDQARDAAMAPVEPLVAALAHELRNPLTTLQTFASVIARKPDSDEAALAAHAVDALGDIERQLDRMQTFAGLETPAMSRVDVGSTLAQTIEAMPEGAQARIKVALDDPTTVTADPSYLAMLLQLLLDEAVLRIAPRKSVVVAALESGAGFEIMIPQARRAASQLEKLLGTDAPDSSWRLSLARTICGRTGETLEFHTDEGALRLAWAPAAQTKETSHG